MADPTSETQLDPTTGVMISRDYVVDVLAQWATIYEHAATLPGGEDKACYELLIELRDRFATFAPTPPLPIIPPTT